MDELRKSPRVVLDEEIHVVDRGEDRRIGVMVNLSAGGLMISGDQPIITNRLYQLRLEWATPVDGKNDIHLGADALWSQPSGGGQHYTGLQLIDIAEDDLSLLLRLAAEC